MRRRRDIASSIFPDQRLYLRSTTAIIDAPRLGPTAHESRSHYGQFPASDSS